MDARPADDSHKVSDSFKHLLWCSQTLQNVPACLTEPLISQTPCQTFLLSPVDNAGLWPTVTVVKMGMCCGRPMLFSALVLQKEFLL